MRFPEGLPPDRVALLARILLTSFTVMLLSLGITQGAEAPGSGSLLQREMLALDSAFKVAVDAVVLNEPGRIGPAFHPLSEIRKEVERAVRGGAVIVLPRNQKRFREFVRLDNKFHRELELLVTAARKNNMGAVQRQTHRLLDGCVRCHRIFRK